MNQNEQQALDLSTLWELIRYSFMMSVALLAGYPFCCMLFSRSWDSYTRYKKSVFSAAVGGGFTVLVWIFLNYVVSVRPEYLALVKGNEVTAAIALLLLIAMAEVILIAVRRSIRIVSLRRKRHSRDKDLGLRKQINT